MKQLFDEDSDRKEALLDSKSMIDAMADLGIRIKDHLHLVVIMTPATFDEALIQILSYV